MIMLFSSNVQSVVMVSGHCSDISAVLQQQDCNVNVAQSGRDVEGSLTLSSFGFYCCSVAK